MRLYEFDLRWSFHFVYCFEACFQFSFFCTDAYSMEIQSLTNIRHYMIVCDLSLISYFFMDLLVKFLGEFSTLFILVLH